MHSAIKMLVDTALQQVPTLSHRPGHNKQQKRLEAMTVPSEMGLLLPVIGGCVAAPETTTGMVKAAGQSSLRVETFQNLWLVLIFCAHIPLRFTWPAGWLPHLRSIAAASPLLIQSRDRLQTTENALSRTLLGEATLSQQMRNHLADSILGDPKLVRTLSMAQSLWLLAVHECERFRSLLPGDGNRHLLAYASDPLIYALNLTDHLQNLSERLLINWLSSHFNVTAALGYTQQLIAMHGHSIESVHRFAQRLLPRLVIELAPKLACERSLWQQLLHRLSQLHALALHEMGVETEEMADGSGLIDPGYARSAFADLLTTCRSVFGVAATITPHAFYSYASQPNNDFVARTELMRQCLPLRSDAPEEYWRPEAALQPLYLAATLTDQVSPLPADAEGMRQACLAWARAIDQDPTHSDRILIQIGIELYRLLGSSPCSTQRKHPFKSRMTFNPSRAPQPISIAPWCVLVDFLEERSLLQPNQHLHRQLWLALLNLSMDRMSLVRVCLWIARRGGERDLDEGHDRLVAFFEQPAGWQVLPREVLLRELGLLSDLATELDRQGGRLFPVLTALLRHERERLAVWLGLPKASMTWHSAAELQRWLKLVMPVSRLLALRLTERWNIHNGHEAFPEEKQAALNHDLLLFYLRHGLPLDTSTLLFAPTGYLVSALMILGHERLSQTPVWCNYALRTLESISPAALFFYTPQIVQLLRRDQLGYVERVAMHIARQSSLFAHQLIWNLMANTHLDDAGSRPDPCKELFEGQIQRIQHLFQGDALDFYQREFSFFRRVTGISGALKPLVKREKWEKKRKIDEELAKIRVDPGVYLPSSPESIVEDIDYDSGRPLQSHAKVRRP